MNKRVLQGCLLISVGLFASQNIYAMAAAFRSPAARRVFSCVKEHIAKEGGFKRFFSSVATKGEQGEPVRGLSKSIPQGTLSRETIRNRINYVTQDLKGEEKKLVKQTLTQAINREFGVPTQGSLRSTGKGPVYRCMQGALEDVYSNISDHGGVNTRHRMQEIVERKIRTIQPGFLKKMKKAAPAATGCCLAGVLGGYIGSSRNDGHNLGSIDMIIRGFEEKMGILTEDQKETVRQLVQQGTTIEEIQAQLQQQERKLDRGQLAITGTTCCLGVLILLVWLFGGG